MSPRSLAEHERKLIQAYSYCQLQMTPQQFRIKWEVTYQDLSLICDCSVATVGFWFSRKKNRRRPTQNDMRHLALVDFLLENFDNIPVELINLLCPFNLD